MTISSPGNTSASNEALRLEELRALEILDTPPEREFDDLTELAALICGVPIALISLIDVERQWFKSRVGLDAIETPRSLAFCAYAINSPDILIVPDALNDARFQANPLVLQDPKIRFYAGSPLITRNGHGLGTLCVIDRIPRELAPDQRKALTILSRQVVSLLERKRAERSLDRAKTQQQQQAAALKASAVREMRAKSLLQHETQLREEAEQLNQVKDEFLGVLSHELRSPVNAILGWAELIARRDLSPQQIKTGCEAIISQSRAQARLVDDLLDMNRISSGKLRLKQQRTDVVAALNAALETVTSAAREKEVSVDVLSHGEDPKEVMADPVRLQQIFWNLLSNAVRFNTPGGRIKASVASSGADIIVSVEDTGIGISSEFLPHVFDRFRQANASTSRRHGGLGLGLSIVKSLAELHGGRVSAFSEGEGRGARFEVRLPKFESWNAPASAESSQAEPSSSPQHEPRALKGYRVLAVDDEAGSLNLLKAILEDEGADVKTADSSDEALKVLSCFEPHVIVSDIGMPDCDGYELLKRMRNGEGARGSTAPAIALTAFARPQERERSLEAGFELHMSKPLNAHSLVQAVHALASRAGKGSV